MKTPRSIIADTRGGFSCDAARRVILSERSESKDPINGGPEWDPSLCSR